jgi:Ras-related protein Rab-11A
LSSLSTAGTPHFFHTFQLSDGSLVNVNIVDTAGQEKYKSINSQYYKKADGCLLVYDISKKETFEEIKGYFYEQIQEKCKKDIKIIILGNKTDLEEERQVSTEEGSNFAAEKGFMFLETSCLQNRFVADSFETLIELTYRDAIEKKQANLSESTLTIRKNSKSKKNKSGCC